MTRLRFAPSPTGYLHVGGLRTALFSFLYAKQQQGSFIFRLEDTDRKRFVANAETDLMQMLQWAGITIDEGPSLSGNYGPYRQSERLAIYQKYATDLLENGHAYPCFCTQERLENLRNEKQQQGLPFKYDGHCRYLSSKTVSEKLEQRVPHVIRMKLPEINETLFINDLIRGKIGIESEELEDQVLMKADGYPTYHLAMVVDDHLMEITHVVRGEEWLPSFPKHILLFRYFGWEPPAFAHLPLILNPDRSKLSKRQGDVALEDFKAQGYLAQTMVNFVTLLGWSSGDDQEIFSLQELIEKFSFERVNKSGSIFDREKLNWMNQRYLQQLSAEEIYSLAKPFLSQSKYSNQPPGKLQQVCRILQPRITTLSDLPKKLPLFFDEESQIAQAGEEVKSILVQETAQVVLRTFVEEVKALPDLTGSSFVALMKSIQKSTNIKGKQLWMPMRCAITLEIHGPDLPLMVDFFGKEKSVAMVQQALEWVS